MSSKSSPDTDYQIHRLTMLVGIQDATSMESLLCYNLHRVNTPGNLSCLTG